MVYDLPWPQSAFCMGTLAPKDLNSEYLNSLGIIFNVTPRRVHAPKRRGSMYTYIVYFCLKVSSV